MKICSCGGEEARQKAKIINWCLVSHRKIYSDFRKMHLVKMELNGQIHMNCIHGSGPRNRRKKPPGNDMWNIENIGDVQTNFMHVTEMFFGSLFLSLPLSSGFRFFAIFLFSCFFSIPHFPVDLQAVLEHCSQLLTFSQWRQSFANKSVGEIHQIH